MVIENVVIWSLKNIKLRIYEIIKEILARTNFEIRYLNIFKSVLTINDMHCIFAQKPPKDKRKVIDAIIKVRGIILILLKALMPLVISIRPLKKADKKMCILNGKAWFKNIVLFTKLITREKNIIYPITFKRVFKEFVMLSENIFPIL